MVAPRKVPANLRRMLERGDAEFAFSSISIAETSIKRGLRRKDFAIDPAVLAGAAVEAGMREITFSTAHALRLGRLGEVHGDPFDRMLVAQAKEEEITLLTVDAALGGYGNFVLVFE